MLTARLTAILVLASAASAQATTQLWVTGMQSYGGGTPYQIDLGYAGTPNAVMVLALSLNLGTTAFQLAPGVGTTLGLDPAGMVAGVVGITDGLGQLRPQMAIGTTTGYGVIYGQALDLALALPITVTGQSPVVPLIDLGSGGVGCGVGDG